jgi:hypothetical protein
MYYECHVTIEPVFGETYYFLNLTSDSLITTANWGDSRKEYLLLERGLVHRSNLAAMGHAKALIGLMQ